VLKTAEWLLEDAHFSFLWNTGSYQVHIITFSFCLLFWWLTLFSKQL